MCIRDRLRSRGHRRPAREHPESSAVSGPSRNVSPNASGDASEDRRDAAPNTPDDASGDKSEADV
eukprot:11389524-Alexandrium_andersonii.AAC.1